MDNRKRSRSSIQYGYWATGLEDDIPLMRESRPVHRGTEHQRIKARAQRNNGPLGLPPRPPKRPRRLPPAQHGPTDTRQRQLSPPLKAVPAPSEANEEKVVTEAEASLLHDPGGSRETCHQLERVC